MLVHLDDATSVPLSELKRRREALGLSVRELASLIGVSPSWIHNIERGHTPLLGAQYLKVLLYLKILGLYPGGSRSLAPLQMQSENASFVLQ